VFEYALRRIDAKPEECVFIDNNSENLTAPKALGMNVIFHDDVKNDVDRLALSLTNEYLIQLD
jgi:FMN phosphatase YigB (HAD superfamily)